MPLCEVLSKSAQRLAKQTTEKQRKKIITVFFYARTVYTVIYMHLVKPVNLNLSTDTSVTFICIDTWHQN